jgi:hypothetical protein
VGTLARTFLPWRFWSSLRMSHPCRWRRLVAYLGLIGVGLYLAFALTHGLTVWMEWRDTVSRAGVSANTDGWPVFWQAAALPLADSAVGSFTGAWGVWSYATPSNVFSYMWYELLFLFLTVLVMHAGCGLTFAALPISRRRCKVRWSHIARVTIYGYVLVLPAVALSLAASPMTMSGARGGSFLAPLAVGAWGALPPMEVAWWTAATSRYLRMPHALGVGLAVAVVGALLALAVMGWIWLAANPV